MIHCCASLSDAASHKHFLKLELGPRVYPPAVQLSPQAYEMIFWVLFVRLEEQGETVFARRTVSSQETLSQAFFLLFPVSAIYILNES